jgi:ATP-binding cassette subfamily F protein 3
LSCSAPNSCVCRQIAHEREQAERAHLQSFIDRFKAKASKAKQAQSRMKRLEKMAGTEAVRAERAFHFQFAVPDRLPDSMLQLEEVEAGYPGEAGQPPVSILHDVRFRLEAGERIGLLGPNGAGKSTLVKTLVGELTPLSGERKAHKDLKIGYFAQHTVESLHEGSSPFNHLQEKRRASQRKCCATFSAAGISQAIAHSNPSTGFPAASAHVSRWR